MGPEHHRHEGPGAVDCAVVTVSSTRTVDDDRSGPAVVTVLEAAGHAVVERRIVDDDVETISDAIEALSGSADVVFLTGGTGPAPSDVTPEAVADLAVKALPGFGERFRRESEAEVGAAAMLSRATAAVVEGEGRAVAVAVPGSPSAARLGAELVADELGHLVGLVEGHSSEPG